MVDGNSKTTAIQVPAQSTRPTADRIARKCVMDEHQLTLPPDLASGKYRLIAGLHDSATGRRAAVITVITGAAGPGVHDVVELDWVRMIGG